MFNRKIEKVIIEHFSNNNSKILCIDGARQIGKTFIIRHVCEGLFKNYIEINMANDYNSDRLFSEVKDIDDFYIQVSVLMGDKLGNKKDTIIFIDEIQVYPHLFTLLKFLKQDDRYSYICSGSQLGIALSNTYSIPMGSIEKIEMYPMDFEEFLWANSVGNDAINKLRDSFNKKESLPEATHNKILKLFKTYLYVGGLPDSVNAYIKTKNIVNIRKVQSETKTYYGEDASKYDKEHKLKIKRIYDLLPTNIDNKVKRIQIKSIEGIDDARYLRYADEFDYLISSGIALPAKAISEPKFPLVQSSSKNLIKLYINDIGILTNILYKNNINAILNDKNEINLGAVYETAVAQELTAHGHKLYYYDRKNVGEVDFLIDDYDNLAVLPLEIKSGMNINSIRALPKIMKINNYHINKGYVLSNNIDVFEKENIIYMPIYYVMFF